LLIDDRHLIPPIGLLVSLLLARAKHAVSGLFFQTLGWSDPTKSLGG
jgi:hypothetical protein